MNLTSAKNPWTAQDSARLYGVNFWGRPYFSVNAAGRLQIHPKAGADRTSADRISADRISADRLAWSGLSANPQAASTVSAGQKPAQSPERTDGIPEAGAGTRRGQAQNTAGADPLQASRAQDGPVAGQNPTLDLFETVAELCRSSSVRLPLLLRFPDIIESQMKNLCGCFKKAVSELGYKGEYYGVFPIKVNQQSHIIEDIVRAGRDWNFGLEAGSKPELLIALALMENEKGLIVCNGFKDRDFLEMAFLAQKAGRNVIVVAERRRETDLMIALSKELNVRPRMGFRLKLGAQAKGVWAESSGDGSKFGFTAEETLSSVSSLKAAGLLNGAELVHFHIGSQAPSIQPVKSAVREATRFMAEMRRIGCPVKYMDVGGGLGVDYDGSGATRSSVNYDVQEYANDVVHGIQSICDEMKTPHPHIISESGRFIAAQSSLLVFDVLDGSFSSGGKAGGESSAGGSAAAAEKEALKTPPLEETGETIDRRLWTKDISRSSFLQELWDIYKNIDTASFNESFNDLVEKKRDIHQLFLYNVLSLKERAIAENICRRAQERLKTLTEGKPDYDDIFNALESDLSGVYFCNFSLFQSLPDSWALSYIFPVMPIHRLNERPSCNAKLVDLTCDSDGRISQFIDYKTWDVKPYLPVHALQNGAPYLMAALFTGAYQEILGDLHNLFGDTDAVHIRITDKGGWSVEHQVEGDSISEVLRYVEFNQKTLLDKMRRITERNIQNGDISRKEAGLLLKKFENSLFQYTYLNDS